MKSKARKVRRLAEGAVLAGYADATADAFQPFDLFEKKLEEHARSLPRTAVELRKQWRIDRMLRRRGGRRGAYLRAHSRRPHTAGRREMPRVKKEIRGVNATILLVQQAARRADARPAHRAVVT